LPEASTLATELLLLAHVPPATESVNVAEEPVHIAGTPVIALTVGKAFTVKVVVAKPVHPPVPVTA
jgi:hypothetical protein